MPQHRQGLGCQRVLNLSMTTIHVAKLYNVVQQHMYAVRLGHTAVAGAGGRCYWDTLSPGPQWLWCCTRPTSRYYMCLRHLTSICLSFKPLCTLVMPAMPMMAVRVCICTELLQFFGAFAGVGS